MTAASPMTGETPVTAVREQIVAALDPVEVALSGTHYVADVLAPLVERIAAEACIEGASGALEAALHEMEDDEDANLLARRADQWRREDVDGLVARRARAAVLRTDSKGDQA